MTFVLAFLGSFFALLVVVALVWTYAVLSALPRLGKWYGDEMAKATGTGRVPTPEELLAYSAQPQPVLVHTCEVHGRCSGCQWVLEHMEAVANVPGFELNDLEMDELVRLRKMLESEPEHPESLDLNAAQALEPITIGKTQLTRSQTRTLFASVSVFIGDLMDDPREAPQAHLRNAREIEKLIMDEVIRPGLPAGGEDARG